MANCCSSQNLPASTHSIRAARLPPNGSPVGWLGESDHVSYDSGLEKSVDVFKRENVSQYSTGLLSS